MQAQAVVVRSVGTLQDLGPWTLGTHINTSWPKDTHHQTSCNDRCHTKQKLWWGLRWRDRQNKHPHHTHAAAAAVKVNRLGQPVLSWAVSMIKQLLESWIRLPALKTLMQLGSEQTDAKSSSSNHTGNIFSSNREWAMLKKTFLSWNICSPMSVNILYKCFTTVWKDLISLNENMTWNMQRLPGTAEVLQCTAVHNQPATARKSATLLICGQASTL